VTRKLLSIDLSSTATGYSVFDIEAHKLLEHGLVLPRKIKKSKTDCQLQVTLTKLKDLAQDIKTLVERVKPSKIVLEQINRGISRHGQKTLDMCHGFVQDALFDWLPLLDHCDSDGKFGWRTGLGLRLSEEDKASNKRNKLLNKTAKRGFKHPIYTAKDLAQRYVNAKYNLNFNVQTEAGANDICDSIALGSFYLQKHYPLKKT
jgi:hypothetical protein